MNLRMRHIHEGLGWAHRTYAMTRLIRKYPFQNRDRFYFPTGGYSISLDFFK